MSIDLDLDLGAAIHAAIGEQTKALHAIHRRLWALQQAIPASIPFGASGLFPASGNLLLAPQPTGPPAGRLWHIRSWKVTGPDPTTSPAGTIYVFIGPNPGDASRALVGRQWRDKSASAMPVPAFYGEYEMVVRFPETIYAVITGGVASTTQYDFSGYAEEVLDSRAHPEVYSI